ncbi:MAG: DNA polymerase III subunit gamma/tau [Clostridia bacterium]|nr:DNA polymerase III subunit gamma/tau [Clostridia bacterium]
MYLALYRKYRPQTFDEVIGQNHIVTTLKNQIKMDKISHAYLFTGSRGTGKTSTAKIFARAINCENNVNGSPCGKCETCKALCGNNIDVLEIDAASNNGVDEVRDLREKVKYPPVVGKYKVYIIDEVHMLTGAAFNALLKTLEEPPQNVVFILATTEVHKLPATILSRCLRFDFKLVSVDELSSLLAKVLNEEQIKFESEAINIIARAAEGSVRDMLSIADRCVSFAGDNLTYSKVVEILGVSEKEELISITNLLLSKNTGETLVELDKILASGKNPLVFANNLVSYLRDLLILYTMGDKAKNIIMAKSDEYEKMKLQATKENYDEIVSAVEILSEIEQDLRYSNLPKMVLEAATIKIINENSLLKRVEKLEEIVNKFPR